MHVKTLTSDVEMKETAKSSQVLGSHDKYDIDMPDSETGNYLTVSLLPFYLCALDGEFVAWIYILVVGQCLVQCWSSKSQGDRKLNCSTKFVLRITHICLNLS